MGVIRTLLARRPLLDQIRHRLVLLHVYYPLSRIVIHRFLGGDGFLGRAAQSNIRSMYFQLRRQSEAIACILVRRLGALPFCELLHMSWMGVSLRYHRILDDQHRPRRDLRVKVVLLGNLVAIDKVVLRHLLFLLDEVVFGVQVVDVLDFRGCLILMGLSLSFLIFLVQITPRSTILLPIAFVVGVVRTSLFPLF